MYDADGRRTQKTTTTGGTVNFLYDLAGHEIAQISSTGVWTRGEVYAGGRHVATLTGTGGTTFFIHSDWLGTERARSAVNGTSAETCTSLAFGDWLTCAGSDVSPMHFTGKERDSESNLDNFGARYNSSSMGRFMTPDKPGYQKKEDPQSMNLYAYVRNRTTVSTDPTGKFDCQGTAYFCFAVNMADFELKQASVDVGNESMFALQGVDNALGSSGDHNGVTISQKDLGAPNDSGGFVGAQTTGKSITFNSNSDITLTHNQFTEFLVHEGTHLVQNERRDAAANQMNSTGFFGHLAGLSWGSPSALSYSEHYNDEYQAYQNQGYMEQYLNDARGLMYDPSLSGQAEINYEQQQVAHWAAIDATCESRPSGCQ